MVSFSIFPFSFVLLFLSFFSNYLIAMRNIVSTFVFIVLLGLVKADVPSPSHNYNVTLPEPNAPYVAGQMLPISYTLPDDTNLPNCK